MLLLKSPSCMKNVQCSSLVLLLFVFTSLTECAQRTLERRLSSLAVLRCGQSATQEKKNVNLHTYLVHKQLNCIDIMEPLQVL